MARLVNQRWIVLALLLAGCVEATAPPIPSAEPASPPTASWGEQLTAVRQGDSDVIRVTARPVFSGEWAELADGCDGLEVLEADYRLLTADDLRVMQSLPHLRRLKLDGQVDDAALDQLGKLDSLTALNVPDGLFTDAGLKAITLLSHLELLRIGSPHVTDDGMASIARLPSLRFLHLIDVPITDAGLVHLHGLTQLESFYLDGDRCTDDGLRTLLEQLPELHFHRDQLHLPDDPNADEHE